MADNIGAQPAQQQQRPEARNGIQVNPRDRLFHAIFIKAATYYVRFVPKWFRTLFEILVLAKALILFTTLSYIHFTFSKNPMDCLESVKDDWPKDGILQVQILKNPINSLNLKILPPYFASERNLSLVGNYSSYEDNGQCLINETNSNYTDVTQIEYESSWTWIDSKIENNYLQKRDTRTLVLEDAKGSSGFHGFPTDLPSLHQLLKFYGQKQPKDHYIMEYALEYGFLRLSQETRERLKIPVKVVTLDPKKDKCFGDSLSRFILDKFLGYDDILMGSIKRLAEWHNNQGYMKNVLTGENYKFVAMWMARTSYIVSFLLMFIFTISISTLLRFCHQQIFIFIVHLLQVVDWNISYAFPIAPLFTVVLSLVGMEAIMAEFFNDTTTSFYVILMVWAADQFDSICCHTKLSQKFWPRFFFLYHFVFYAYHYRFNGQYSSIALASTWFFIQHSMLYFLHNYEIPAVQAEIDQEGNFAANYLDDAVDLLVDEMQYPAFEPSAQANPAVNDLGDQSTDSATQETAADNSGAQHRQINNSETAQEHLSTGNSSAQRSQSTSDQTAEQSLLTGNSGARQDIVNTDQAAQGCWSTNNSGARLSQAISEETAQQSLSVDDSGAQTNPANIVSGAHENSVFGEDISQQRSVPVDLCAQHDMASSSACAKKDASQNGTGNIAELHHKGIDITHGLNENNYNNLDSNSTESSRTEVLSGGAIQTNPNILHGAKCIDNSQAADLTQCMIDNSKTAVSESRIDGRSSKNDVANRNSQNCKTTAV